MKILIKSIFFIIFTSSNVAYTSVQNSDPKLATMAEESLVFDPQVYPCLANLTKKTPEAVAQAIKEEDDKEQTPLLAEIEHYVENHKKFPGKEVINQVIGYMYRLEDGQVYRRRMPVRKTSWLMEEN